jgi:hypothetical protein
MRINIIFGLVRIGGTRARACGSPVPKVDDVPAPRNVSFSCALSETSFWHAQEIQVVSLKQGGFVQVNGNGACQVL